MIIKEADDRSGEMAALELAVEESNGTAASRARESLRRRRAGLKGESESSYHINFHFGSSANWFVLHDLRLVQNGRTAQIDHLLLSRDLSCYVLESKHFHAGLKITDEGEFLRWNNYRKTYEGMESPLAQNQRHVLVLRDVFKTMDMPTRLGVRLMPKIYPYVLVSAKSRIDRSTKFDSSAVIKADKIRKQFEENLDSESTLETMMSVARFVSADTARTIAERLAALHRPVAVPGVSQEDPVRTPKADGESQKQVNAGGPPLHPPAGRKPPASATIVGPSCKSCHGTDGSILHGKYGYYFKCSACQANTSIKFDCQPEHRPRLRKSKLEFYRDCPDCGTSELYFVNS